ncbi:MAG: radical SAM protein [Candidatus Portnoybacteria bacterium]|nr:radical SAM protein [Candidatus Portnoybacteria bacterium]MDD4982498.1 radical SAM protein [Candidatus Portnoybacteria bacterium]
MSISKQKKSGGLKVVLIYASRASGEIELKGLPFLSVGYLASSILADGHAVSIIDAHTFGYSPQEAARRALELGPDIVGLAANTHNRFLAIETARHVKKGDGRIKIFTGGPHFGLTAKNALAVVPEIDFVIKGEGEITSRELLKTNFKPDKMKDVLGLVWRDGFGNIVENPDRAFMWNLDELPWPAWDLFGLENYGGTPIEKGGDKTIGVISSRGCPNRCIFCSSLAFHKGALRLRSAENFVDELELLNKRYGFKAFKFWDDTFTIVRRHAEDVCNEILKRRLAIKWYAPCRVNTVDKELLALMKKAGCVRVNFGIESGSPRVLKIMKKGITMDQARTAIKAALEVGLDVTLNFLMIFPHETMADIAMTVDAIQEFKAMGAKPSYSFIVIYPGTELEAIAKQEGLMPVDFSWNSPYKSEKSYIAGEDPSVPYFEWPELPFELVKAFVLKRMGNKKNLAKRFFKKLRRVRQWEDLRSLGQLGVNYLKAQIKAE